MNRIIIIGAGLVGSVLAMFLARKGYKVDVYERQPDLREVDTRGGRSINLTLCDRGFKALDEIGVGHIIRAISVPAYGRLIHDVKGEMTLQPYGNNNEAIHSISRSDLNKALLNFAEQNFDIAFHFNQKCLGVDLDTATVELEHLRSGRITRQKSDRVFGTDGAHSSVRMQMQKRNRFDFCQRYWEQGYKELDVPLSSGGWTSEKNVLHLWPRGGYMLIGFPNIDGSFTCSLHIPFEGPLSFEAIKTQADLLGLFKSSFPDVIDMIPNIVEDFFRNTPNPMVTIKCSPWTFQDKVSLIGDAAHAIYPSYGQGANAGFEDCATLDECLDAYGEDWKRVLTEYEKRRKPNTDAIADLCVEHFVELRDLVGDSRFLLRKEIERRINLRYPEKYKDLYSMITFTCMPYIEALRIDREQRAILDRLMEVEAISDKLASGEITNLIDEAMLTR
ncbi:MAG: NAD(P)/FAD-dependent oxidoreductase [Blastocatellia bacterium]